MTLKNLKDFAVGFASVFSVANHIALVRQHKRTCPECVPLDYLAIARNLAHLYPYLYN